MHAAIGGDSHIQTGPDTWPDMLGEWNWLEWRPSMLNLRLVRDTIRVTIASHLRLHALYVEPAVTPAAEDGLHAAPAASASLASGGTQPAAARPALAWRAVVAQAAALWLATRVAFVVLTYFAVILTSRSPASGSVPVAPHVLLSAWNRWDTIWYIRIAQLGYYQMQASAFFPLYPLLIRPVGILTAPHWLAAALIVSNLGALAAFIGLGLWAAQEDHSHRGGVRVVRAIAAYPLALFLFAGYSEGIFIALVAFTLFFARRGAWQWAALAAFLAGLTRATAVALVLPLLWEYGRQHDWWRRDRWLPRGWRSLTWRELGLGALAAGAVPLAFACYELYVWHRFHQKNVILRVESVDWHHTAMNPIQAAVAVAGQFFQTAPWTYWQAHQLLDVVPVVVFALITLFTMRRMPFSYTLLTAGVIYLAIASPITQGYPDLLMSVGRYMLAAIPVFLILGRWMGRYPWLDMLLTSGGFMLQGVLVVVFLGGGWLI